MFEDSLFKEIFESGAKTKLLIVPAQLTLSAEQAAFAYAKCDVFFDFHVMSGNKLRAEIMNKTGGPGRTPINSLGRDMILRRIAKENADKLSVYQSCVTSSEFIKYAGDFIVQMKQTNPGGIDLLSLADELAGAKGGAAQGRLLPRKLKDMALIADAYSKVMQGKYIDSRTASPLLPQRSLNAIL
jgi:ATP-dependent helicase/nuclease subunit B